MPCKPVTAEQQQQAKNGQSDDCRYRGPDFIPEVQAPVVVDKHTYNRLGDVIGETHPPERHDKALELVSDIVLSEPEQHKNRYQHGH